MLRLLGGHAMKFINTNFEIPYYNFALEDYLLTDAPEDDYVFFYIHKPSIIVGKYQNTLAEINKEYVEKHHILVARRLSGGGAVYHDDGNLNFSFVHRASREDVNNFEKFTQPVVEALQSLKVDAKLSGRNDLLVEDKKISGNAQCFKNGRLLHHGTLLYNADMSHLVQALNVRDIKIKSKGIASVRSRVANIAEYMASPMEIHEFKNYLLSYFSKSKNIEEMTLDKEVLASINQKVADQFSTWEWNWGKSPKYQHQISGKFPCGLIDLNMNIEEGIIKDIKIYGDFFTSEEIETLENILKGTLINRDALEAKLKDTDISLFFNQLSNHEFIEFILSQ